MAISSANVGGVQQGQGTLPQGMASLQQATLMQGQNARDNFNRQLETFNSQVDLSGGLESLVLFSPELANQYAQANGIDITQFQQKMAPVQRLLMPGSGATREQVNAALEPLQDSMSARQFVNLMGRINQMFPNGTSQAPVQQNAQNVDYNVPSPGNTPPSQNVAPSVSPNVGGVDTRDVVTSNEGTNIFQIMDNKLGGKLSSASMNNLNPDDAAQLAQASSELWTEIGVDPNSAEGVQIANSLSILARPDAPPEKRQEAIQNLSNVGSSTSITQEQVPLQEQYQQFATEKVQQLNNPEVLRSIQPGGDYVAFNQTLPPAFDSSGKITDAWKNNPEFERMFPGTDRRVAAANYEVYRRSVAEQLLGEQVDPNEVGTPQYWQDTINKSGRLRSAFGAPDNRNADTPNIGPASGETQVSQGNMATPPTQPNPSQNQFAQGMSFTDIANMSPRERAQQASVWQDTAYEAAKETRTRMEQEVQTQQQMGMGRDQAMRQVGMQYAERENVAGQVASDFFNRVQNDPEVKAVLAGMDPAFAGEIQDNFARDLQIRAATQEYNEMIDSADARRQHDILMRDYEEKLAAMNLDGKWLDVAKSVLEYELMTQPSGGTAMEQAISKLMLFGQVASTFKGTESEKNVTEILDILINQFKAQDLNIQDLPAGLAGLVGKIFTPQAMQNGRMSGDTYALLNTDFSQYQYGNGGGANIAQSLGNVSPADLQNMLISRYSGGTQ